jgi:hypothetical protein
MEDETTAKSIEGRADIQQSTVLLCLFDHVGAA